MNSIINYYIPSSFLLLLYLITENINSIQCYSPYYDKYLLKNICYIENAKETKISFIDNFLKNDIIIENDNNEEHDIKRSIYFNNTKSEKDDLYYIKNYKGEELEPEWDWVKNISIVYTWVDGSDPNLLDSKYKYNGGLKSTTSRDRSADELRYSLRSLEKYLPWHKGKIYIVTANQIPHWLNTNHPRIEMIYHKDIIPKYIYPTFDSNTIELYFDKIPGITEKFIYFNDDFFFNNYIHPCLFFTKEGFFPKFFRNKKSKNISEKLAEKIAKRNNIHEIYHASVYVTSSVIKKYLDENFSYHYLEHSGYVFYRDLIEPFRQFFKNELKDVIADKLRNPYKIQSIYLYQTFVQYIKLNKEFLTNKLPGNKTIENYSSKIEYNTNNLIFFGEISDNLGRNKRYFNYFKRTPKIKIYNLNDRYKNRNTFYQLTEYMIMRYPNPSSFEKKEYIEIEDFIPKLFDEYNSFVKNLSKIIPKRYDKKNIFASEIFRQNVVKEYIMARNSLSELNKEISDREEEEIEFLLNYTGGELNKEWHWAKKISIVYILNEDKWKDETGKYREFNKLILSIHSLKKYLPWFEGKIFIIGNDDNNDELVMSYLKDKNIKIINKNEIIPKHLSENSSSIHLIEMFMDKIPNISERFVYMKSDYYFINYTHPRFFFNMDYFPKYNLKSILNHEELENAKNKDRAFIDTYEIINEYFGKSYVKGYRYFENAPISFYRDLFHPVRELFNKNIKDYFIKNKNEILPFYLMLNYNLYGTDQPFYPKFVSGYGKIKESKLPVLNTNHTIDYYGYDITTREIFEKTLLTDISITENFCDDHSYLIDSINSKILFISFKEINIRNLKNLNCFFNYLSDLYGIKLSYKN